jgi:hypothetical protein
MAGGAQALMRNPAAGQSQGEQTDRTKLDPFVREHLSRVLMKMSPLDGLLEDAAHNWCLSDARGDAVLVYTLAGSSFTLTRPLPRGTYSGLWFDPRTGETRLLDAPRARGSKGRLSGSRRARTGCAYTASPRSEKVEPRQWRGKLAGGEPKARERRREPPVVCK